MATSNIPELTFEYTCGEDGCNENTIAVVEEYVPQKDQSHAGPNLIFMEASGKWIPKCARHAIDAINN